MGERTRQQRAHYWKLTNPAPIGSVQTWTCPCGVQVLSRGSTPTTNEYASDWTWPDGRTVHLIGKALRPPCDRADWSRPRKARTGLDALRVFARG